MTKQIVAIRFGVNQDLSTVPDLKEEFERVFDLARPQSKSTKPRNTKQRLGYVQEQARQLRYFVHGIETTRDSGDLVITYGGNRNGRKYFIGDILSHYIYDDEGPCNLSDHHHHKRSVKWRLSCNRDALSSKTRNVLGIPPTVFPIDLVAEKEVLEESKIL